MQDKKNIYQKLFEVKKAGIKLQRDTKAFNYKYATLSQIQEKLNGEFQKQNLLVLHRVDNNKVKTSIIDIDAGNMEFNNIESSIEMTEGTKAQDKGSEITYYRRYNLLSLLDLEVEDDDGKKAQDSKPAETKKWLNYENFEQIVEAGNTTEADIGRVLKEDGYTLSAQAKIAVRTYCETGELNKNLFFKQN